MNKDCFIYIIEIEEHGLVKIGVSDSPKVRLKQLQTGSPFKMRIAHMIPTPSKPIAMALESAFHSVKSDLRSHGEWFKMSADEAKALMWLNLVAFMDYLEIFGEDRKAIFARCGFGPEGSA